MNERREDLKDNSIEFGTALIERPILTSLTKLWEGGLEVSDLEEIEIGIRAFVLSKHMVVSQIGDAWESASEYIFGDPYSPYNGGNPFGDPTLDYEFFQPTRSHLVPRLPSSESEHLTKFVSHQVKEQLRNVLPKWLATEGAALEFTDKWYAGYPLHECERYARNPVEWNRNSKPLNVNEFFESGNHPVLHLGPVEHAKYLLGCHRAGLSIYSATPLGKICDEFTFSEWPRKIFEDLDSRYKAISRSVRGPGISIDLPPLTSALLSRANRRSNIPCALREMREEYESSRNQLWSLLEKMWTAPTFQEQNEYLKVLQQAATSIVDSAFPDKFNVLSLGISLASLTPNGFASAAKSILDRDGPNARVTAVSFAGKIQNELRKTILNSRVLFERHLSRAEKIEFGIG